MATIAEQREAAIRRVAEASARIGELTASRNALDLRAASRSAELEELTAELARAREEHFSKMAELSAALAAEQKIAGRNWDDRCRFHAELVEATVRGEQATKELIAAHQRLAQLESALRQRQEETEQTHKALGQAGVREAELRQALEAGAVRETALEAKLGSSEDRVSKLVAQHYAALADARSARSQIGRLAVDLRQAQDEAQSQLEAMQNQLGMARAEAQSATLEALSSQRVAAERAEKIARLDAALEASNRLIAERDRAVARLRSELDVQASVQSGLIEKSSGQRAQIEKQEATAEWMRQVYAVVRSSPFWWRLLPPAWRRRRENRRLEQLGLFDQHNYLARYPDVADAGLDPLRHYFMHGISEGRQF